MKQWTELREEIWIKFLAVIFFFPVVKQEVEESRFIELYSHSLRGQHHDIDRLSVSCTVVCLSVG